jgi:hypothetical protein
LSSFSSTPVPVAADGGFVTPRLKPGHYVLEIVRAPFSATSPATVVGWKLVTVGASDVAGITVDVRRDVAMIGTFRMESDDPQAEWPSHVHVIPFLALAGAPLGSGGTAEGRPAGEFLLRNVYGPRVLRVGYMLRPGAPSCAQP